MDNRPAPDETDIIEDAKPVDVSLAIPLYHQVYLIIKDKIDSGEYAPGAPVPTEQELCTLYGVSRITVKRAMQDLADQGLIVRQRGRGSFVAERKAVSTSSGDALNDLFQNVMSIGKATEVLTIDAGVILAPSDLANRLQCPVDTPIFRTIQVRTQDGEPIAVIRAYVPEDIALTLPEHGRTSLPMLAQLLTAGVKPARAEQTVTATLADPQTASRLDVAAGTALLRLTRLVFDNKGRPVEWLDALYRGDRYAYRSSLTHGPSASGGDWTPSYES